MDISVPRLSKGRTTNHTERYAIAHMLSTLIGKNRLFYPLELIKRERPDFLLKSGEVQIGIEHTEAVPENEARKTVLRDKQNGPEVYSIYHRHPGEPKKSKKLLIREIESVEEGDGWAGDSVEVEWSIAMDYFVRRKIDKLMKAGFEKFNQNWLLIYDNWRLPALIREKATSCLLRLVLRYNCFEKFDHIYIISGSLLCELSSAGVAQHEINNLWIE